MPVKLRIVSHEMLDRGTDALALKSDDVLTAVRAARYGSSPKYSKFLPIQRRPINVDPRSEQKMHAAGPRVLTKTTPCAAPARDPRPQPCQRRRRQWRVRNCGHPMAHPTSSGAANGYAGFRKCKKSSTPPIRSIFSLQRKCLSSESPGPRSSQEQAHGLAYQWQSCQKKKSGQPTGTLRIMRRLDQDLNSVTGCQRCTLPDPPPLSSAFTSSTVDRLKSPGMRMLQATGRDREFQRVLMRRQNLKAVDQSGREAVPAPTRSTMCVIS